MRRRVALPPSAPHHGTFEELARRWLLTHEIGHVPDQYEPSRDKRELRLDAAGAQVMLAHHLGGVLPAWITARHTTWADGHLVSYQHDDDDQVLVLVTGRADDPNYIGQGWCHVHEREQRGVERVDGEWWLGQGRLRPMSTLGQTEILENLGAA